MTTLLIDLALIALILLTALGLGLGIRAIAGIIAGPRRPGERAGDASDGPTGTPFRSGPVDLETVVLRGAELEMRALRPGAAQPMARLAGEVEQRRRVEADALHHHPMISRPDLTFFGLR